MSTPRVPRSVLIRSLAAAFAIAAVAWPVAAQGPRTAAESTTFQRHTTHPEMMDYLVKVRATSTEMRLSSYGESREGRVLPYAIFSRPLITQPWEAALLGKPIVAFNGNVHGGERTLRESLLILMREIATPGTPENRYLDDMVIIIAPQINPDGFHSGGRGVRGNAWGIDLNRDYIKLEHPEIANYIGNVINEWHPHLFVDGHNGGSQPYNINYQCASHGSPDPKLTEICDFDLFPFIDRAMIANGFKSWYYTGGTPTRWNTGGFQARIGRNYGGFANSVGILFESPGQDLTTGVKSGLVAFKAVLEYVKQNKVKLMTTVQTARQETIAMGLAARGDIVVQMRYGPEDRKVTYEVPARDSTAGAGGGRGGRGGGGAAGAAGAAGGGRAGGGAAGAGAAGGGGAAGGRAAGGGGAGGGRGGTPTRYVTVTSDSLMKKPIPTKTRPRPYAYLLPREATEAVAMLRRHKITVEVLEDAVTLDVAAYPIQNVQYTPQYNHAAAVVLTVADPVNVQRNFPRGTYVVPTGQILGRVAAHMLEPETDDNVIYWNTMDAWLPRPRSTGAVAAVVDPDDAPPPQVQGGAQYVPIFKLMTPKALPSRVVK